MTKKTIFKFLNIFLYIFAIYYIYLTLVQYKDFSLYSIKFEYLFLFLFFSISSRYLLALAFKKVVQLVDKKCDSLSFKKFFFITAKSNILKYIPIKIGSIGTKIYYLKKFGISNKKIGKASFLEYTLPNISNILLVIVLLPMSSQSEYYEFLIRNQFTVLSLLASICLFVTSYLYLNNKKMLKIVVLYTSVSLLSIINIFLITLALRGETNIDLVVTLGTSFLLSQTIVSLTPFLPNLGVREILNFFLLSNFYSQTFIVSFLFIARLIPTISDILFYAFTYSYKIVDHE